MANEQKTEKNLPEAAKRAIAEADKRRDLEKTGKAASPQETGGRKGPDPTRYGDWEKNGITSDF